MSRDVKQVRIDILSDVVCPWCVIGFKQLQTALRECPEIEADIRWLPFELNPHMPPGGENLREHLAGKYGTTLEGSIAARKRLTRIGADLGFQFNYFNEMRMFNTFKAHQLLHWAGDRQTEKQTGLKMALFEAYFRDGRSVDQEPVLLDAVEKVGLSRDKAARILRDEIYGQVVKNLETHWLQQGVTGVPAFIFNQRYVMTGAQPAENFKQQLSKLAAEAA